MNSTERRFDPVWRQIAVYEESWQQDHDEAMRCRDLEDGLAVGVALFHLIERIDQSWRDRVFRGAEPFQAEDDAAIRLLYELWLHPSGRITARIEQFEAKFENVERAGEFRVCRRRALETLAAWSPPALSAAVGLREMTLGAEAAGELQALLDRPPASPVRPSRRLPVADSSFLRKPQKHP
jgi:hypothetical protein